MAKPELSIWEFGLRRPRAAAFVGVSVVHFDKLVAAGIMPQPRPLDGVRVWLRPELEEALLSLPPEVGCPVDNPCDRLLAS